MPSTPPSPNRWNPLETLSPGGWIILIIAVISTGAVLVWPIEKTEGLQLWTFARNHSEVYENILDRRNREAEQTGQPKVTVFTIDGPALNRRTLAGFWSGTPVADLIEIERSAISQYVSGPIENVGFTDLTDTIVAEGLDQKINPPSFSPWTSRGRIFGLPHDVHPVLLCYRADLVEQAGIDVNQIETWDDFAEVLRPLIADLDGDGKPDRYLLNSWYTAQGELEALLLQAGGGTFDSDGDLLVASEANAKVLAQFVAWTLGPDRIAIDAPDFSASGNQLKIEGKVVAQIMPDWLAGIWKSDMPQLGGKLKLMPLPAWEPGGRRTSVRGGTMIGIPKATEDFDAAWAVAKDLYLSPKLAKEMFQTSNIISPVMELWDEPYYAEPDPFFSDQPSGSLFIEQAPHVPFRSSNPFHVAAMNRISEAATTLYGEASEGAIVPLDQIDADALLPRAQELLKVAEKRVLKEMSRNVFLRKELGITPDGERIGEAVE